MSPGGLFWWGLTLACITLTYATLGQMPAYWRAIDNALSGHGLLFQYALYSGTGAAVLFFLHRKSFLSDPMNLAVTVAAFAAFAVMFYFEANPGEKIHMLQYGIVGWLLHRSLSIHLSTTRPALYLVAGMTVLVVGAVDEGIQHVLPNRYFTVHDVFINGLSGMVVQLYIGYYYIRTRTAGGRAAASALSES